MFICDSTVLFSYLPEVQNLIFLCTFWVNINLFGRMHRIFLWTSISVWARRSNQVAVIKNLFNHKLRNADVISKWMDHWSGVLVNSSWPRTNDPGWRFRMKWDVVLVSQEPVVSGGCICTRLAQVLLAQRFPHFSNNRAINGFLLCLCCACITYALPTEAMCLLGWFIFHYPW